MIIRRYAAECANVSFGLLEDRFKGPRAVADLEDRHADARQRDQIPLDLFQHRHGQYRGTRGEVVDTMNSGHLVTRCRSRMSLFPVRIVFRSLSDGAPSRLMRATAACAPSKMMFSVSWTLMLSALRQSNTCARTPGRSRCLTTRMCVAGVFFARLTTFGTLPVSLYVATMRTVSAATASCAWSVDAPMWWVP